MEKTSSVQFDISAENEPHIKLSGSLTFSNASELWGLTSDFFRQFKGSRLIIDGSAVDSYDSSGAAYLIWIGRRCDNMNITYDLTGFSDSLLRQIEAMRPGRKNKTAAKYSNIHTIIEDVGAATYSVWDGLSRMLVYLGEILYNLFLSLKSPKRFRLKDTLIVAELSGADAIGISALLGGLFGLILAFQSVITLKMFAAEIFVIDLVVIAMFRVMASFIAAILYASRSGSAFAAEIATMKVNEEISALKTMGLSPIQFLVLPRVVAATLIVPMLALFVILSAFIGCGFVMYSMDYPLVTIVQNMKNASDVEMFLSGFVKSFVYGYIIAAVGCFRGLNSGSGPRAVGQASTSAVVTSIVLIVVAEGIFSVVYYFLGI
ncbi:putative phospholipid ABC transporter permease protein MlaE [Limihaloglobus sulfuriphilus]|uniref:Putative phospholipid ABC transporter permease protein MlaE n=2 Tax=Limihaloglobus sulfuriphilus TaxID=1851148 RepID=A0A1Q2MC83_9BACT|nr:putative phospholipid ABC transporter permease protein MlaE [Limihaloglobus sulfuriphilus]